MTISDLTTRCLKELSAKVSSMEFTSESFKKFIYDSLEKSMNNALSNSSISIPKDVLDMTVILSDIDCKLDTLLKILSHVNALLMSICRNLDDSNHLNAFAKLLSRLFRSKLS